MNADQRLPAVDRVARALADVNLPHAVLVRITRRILGKLREVDGGRGGEGGAEPTAVIAQVRAAAEKLARSGVRLVINATGIVIHTNLGRSPLGESAVAAVTQAASQFSTLEYDVETGERGRRGELAEELLATLCESEAAACVNNCAAGLLLILQHFTRGERKEVIISRGELVQIGGGFRVPEILEASGAVLREVGTTNQTTVADYDEAVTDRTAMILHVHRSNFWMEGFVGSPALREIAALAERRKLPLVEDLGSGAMASTQNFPAAAAEPTPADVLHAGAHLVSFSGDKLFGGPQAGIVAGTGEHIQALKREPMYRALRCGKLVIAALEATALAHLRGEATDLPIITMLHELAPMLRVRAQRIIENVGTIDGYLHVVASEAQVGGGSLPQARIPSIAIEVTVAKARVEDVAARLRQGEPAVVGYIAGGKVRLDLRAVLPHQDAAIVDALRKVMAAR